MACVYTACAVCVVLAVNSDQFQILRLTAAVRSYVLLDK